MIDEYDEWVADCIDASDRLVDKGLAVVIQEIDDVPLEVALIKNEIRLRRIWGRSQISFKLDKAQEVISAIEKLLGERYER